jgi:hypothetical protein
MLLTLDIKMLYNANRLMWQSGDESTRTPQVSVWSCKVAGVTFGRFNRLAAAHARAKTTEHLAGFFFWRRPYSTRKQCIYMDGLEQNIGLCNHPTDNPRELCARYHARLVDMVRQDTNRLNRILQGKLVTFGNGLKGECYSPLGVLLSERKA